MDENKLRGLVARASLQMAQAQANLYSQRRLDAIFFGWKPEPLTRRQKIAAWLRERKERVVLAYRVLRGDDIGDGY